MINLWTAIISAFIAGALAQSFLSDHKALHLALAIPLAILALSNAFAIYQKLEGRIP